MTEVKKLALVRQAKSNLVRQVGRMNVGPDFDTAATNQLARMLVCGASRERENCLRIIDKMFMNSPEGFQRDVLAAIVGEIESASVIDTLTK
tara:strand:- start:107 stop:382 length:276 start_codon:yes stop_codon:yes gene_type:complete